MVHGVEPGRPDPGRAEPTRIPARRAGPSGLGVAVIDPVPIFREGLHATVHRTPGLTWIGQAAAHHSALQLCEQLRPDITLLDSGLDPNGHLGRLLAAGDPSMVLISLVRRGDHTAEYLSTAIAAGVHALVPRSIEPRGLAEAIRRAYTDRRYLDPSLVGLATPPKRPPQPRRDGSPERIPPGLPGQMPLSRREYQVLQLVAEGLENSAVAKTLFLSVETVRTHVKSILRKLAARDRTHAVTIAFRAGILITRIEPLADPALDEPVLRGC